MTNDTTDTEPETELVQLTAHQPTAKDALENDDVTAYYIPDDMNDHITETFTPAKYAQI